jgi:putative transcriptional regulator
MKKISERTLTKAVDAQVERFASNLFEFRNSMELSQEKLARLAGIDRKTVNRIENGHFSPSLETMTRLANALNCTVIKLVK